MLVVAKVVELTSNPILLIYAPISNLAVGDATGLWSNSSPPNAILCSRVGMTLPSGNTPRLYGLECWSVGFSSELDRSRPRKP